MLITLTGYPALPGLGNIMSDMVESMSLDVSVLGASWHGLENPFNGAMTAKEALTTAGIDWRVDQAPVFVDGKEVPGFKANIRSKDSLVLGFVSDVYRPIQNYEAFDFVDEIIGNGEAKYHSAGCLFNKYDRPTRIFITAQLKPLTLMGDKIDNYLVFSHSHDGLNAVKVFVTPVRVVCNNTLTLAQDSAVKDKKASRFWSTKHTGDIKHKLQIAQQTMKLYEEYISAIPVIAESMNSINLYPEEEAMFIEALFPDDGTQGKSRMSQNAETMRNEIMKCYNFKHDIERFRGTAWGMYQAVTDIVEHISPFRQTKTAELNREFSVIEGHPVIMRAQKMLCSIKG